MNLKQFIKSHWKNYNDCANELGVSYRTIVNYVHNNPTGILKHTAVVTQKENVEPLTLFDAVACTMEEKNENRAHAHN
jgi:hypothetical protein